MSMLKEFKEFAMRGNMLDLAVGVIIGGAFGKIVSSLVNDIIMPVVSIFTGEIDFSNLFIALDGKKYGTLQQAKEAGAATLNYGVLITKYLNRLRPQPAPAPITKTCPYCLSSVHINATRCPHCTSDLNEH